MSFSQPLLLLLGLPLAVALVAWPLRSRVALSLRIATTLLLILALAGVSITLPSRNGMVVVVADRKQIERDEVSWRLCGELVDPRGSGVNALLKRLDHVLCWNVPNQRILGERTSTKPTDGRIKAAETSVPCSEHFG